MILKAVGSLACNGRLKSMQSKKYTIALLVEFFMHQIVPKGKKGIPRGFEVFRDWCVQRNHVFIAPRLKSTYGAMYNCCRRVEVSFCGCYFIVFGYLCQFLQKCLVFSCVLLCLVLWVFFFWFFFLVILCCYTYIYGGCVSIFPYFVLLC